MDFKDGETENQKRKETEIPNMFKKETWRKNDFLQQL